MTREQCLLNIEKMIAKAIEEARDPKFVEDEEDFENIIMNDMTGCIQFCFMEYTESRDKMFNQEEETDPENIYNLPGIRQSIEEDRK